MVAAPECALTQLWRPPVPALTLTGWQLTAGGLLLVPLALISEPALPPLSLSHLVGFLWLGLAGGALSYLLWFRGLDRLGPEMLTGLGFLSPLTAVTLGWLLLGQGLGLTQLAGSVLVLGSVWLSTRPDLRG